MNWFTLLIVFVFDPLAISMVIALNKLINKEGDGSNKDDSTRLFSDTNSSSISNDVNADGRPVSTTRIEVDEKRSEVKKEKVEEPNKKPKKEKVEFIPTDEEAVNIYGEPKKKRYNDSVAAAEGRK